MELLPHCSPPPWDTSGLEQIKFQPFSQPRDMTDSTPWSCGSNPPFYQLETPTAAQVLFGNSELAKIEAGEVSFSLNQPEDKEPMLDFMLNQSETEQRFEEEVFRGFSNEEYERQASHFGSAKSKIYLKDGTPVQSSAPQTVPGSQSMEMEESSLPHLSNCSDINFSCPGHNTGPMNGCGYSPSYSCRGGYLSSDSNDDEDYCQPCLQASSSSYMEQSYCADTPNLVSQEKPERPRPLTPVIKPQMNLRVDQRVMETAACPDKALGQQTGSSTAQFASPHPLAQTQSPDLCKCKKASGETRDAGTQTVETPAAETHDASTQCWFVADRVSKARENSLYLPPVDMSVQHAATGRQTDTATEPNSSGSGGKNTPWGKMKSKAGSLSGSSITNKLSADGGDSIVFPQRSINCFLDALTDGRGKENGEGRDERGKQENGPLMKGSSEEVREEVTSATTVNRLSEEAETLQEIADILLLLKQREKEGW
ncbi:uncharacterized protein LOC120799693 isoform X4 [Lates japonicus]